MTKKQGRKYSSALLMWMIVIAVVIIACIRLYEVYIERQVGFVRYDAFGIDIPVNYGIHGIDVSRYQQVINWNSVRDMRVEGVAIGFAFIKATEGNVNVDRYFRRNWRKSREARLTRGAYHFFIATKNGRTQAENFIKTVNLSPGDLPPVLDIEQTYGVPGVQLRKRVREWLDIVEEHYKVKPVIYTNVDFYRRHLGDEFDEYPLWVAHYLQKRRPRIHRDWIFWQHSELGKVNGISSNVDFNVFNGDSTEFREILMK